MGDVVDFFSRNRNVVSAEQAKPQADSETAVDFSSIAERNAQVQAKLREERAQANQNVLKSYRIK